MPAFLQDQGCAISDAMKMRLLLSTEAKYASLRFALGDDPIYVASQLGHTEGAFSMRVYARAVKRRGRLSGAHLREFDRALAWGEIGSAETEIPPVQRRKRAGAVA